MKISDLIEKLEEYKAEYGDIGVYTLSPVTGQWEDPHGLMPIPTDLSGKSDVKIIGVSLI